MRVQNRLRCGAVPDGSLLMPALLPIPARHLILASVLALARSCNLQ